MKLWSKVLQIFLLFSLYFSSLNLKYLKLTKMNIMRFAMKLFNCIMCILLWMVVRLPFTSDVDTQCEVLNFVPVHLCYSFLYIWYRGQTHKATKEEKCKISIIKGQMVLDKAIKPHKTMKHYISYMYVQMHCHSWKSSSLGHSKFRNYDPITTTRDTSYQ